MLASEENNAVRIQDLDARLDGKEATMTTSRIGVLDADGRVAYVVKLLEDGSLRVECGEPIQANGVWLDNRLCIAPASHDRVSLFRPPSKE